MKNYLLITLLTFGFAANVSAQEEETVFGNPDVRLSGIWVSLNPTYSYFNDDFTYDYGFSIAGEISRTVLLGYTRHDFREEPLIGDDNKQTYDLSFNGFMVGFTPRSFKAIHPRVTLAAGSGDIEVGGEDDRVFVIQPSLGVEINATQWCRLGLEGGYRMITYNDLENISNSDLASPFIQASIRFGVSWGD